MTVHPNNNHPSAPENPREALLRQVLVDIQKAHGKGAIMALDANPEPVETTSSGSIGLDLALGSGGYPRGRIVEIYGPEASGKTTLTLHALAEMQKMGGRCAFIDAEHALDPVYARSLGVDLEHLLVSQPDNGEQGLDIVEMLVRSNCLDMVVVDSVAALAPRDELEGQMGDTQMGLQARMMSKAMRKLTTVVSKSNTTLIFINQVRQKIGVTFGPSEVTTGGNALKYYASVRLDVRRIGALKKDEEAIGNRTRVKVVKNKLAPPFRQVEFDIVFGKGIHQLGEVADLAEERGIVQKAGAWYSYGEQRWQGRDKFCVALEADPALFGRLRSELALSTGKWGAAEA
jgi:recombination protein RecA